MCCRCGTWFSGGLGKAKYAGFGWNRLMVGLENLKGLFHSNMIL